MLFRKTFEFASAAGRGAKGFAGCVLALARAPADAGHPPEREYPAISGAMRLRIASHRAAAALQDLRNIPVGPALARRDHGRDEPSKGARTTLRPLARKDVFV